MVFKAYKDGFINLTLGSAATQSVVLMVVVILLSVLQCRIMEQKVFY